MYLYSTSCKVKYHYLYSVVISASSWGGWVGGMPTENRQVWKGNPFEFPPQKKNLPTTAGHGNQTHDLSASLQIPVHRPDNLATTSAVAYM